MNLSVGDKVKIAIPKTDKTILGNIPRFKTLEVVGIFDLGLYEYDSNLIFLSSELVRKLLLYDEDIHNKIEFFTSSPNEIELFKNKVELETSKLLLDFYSISWKDQNKTLINALKVEKNVMFIILSLIESGIFVYNTPISSPCNLFPSFKSSATLTIEAKDITFPTALRLSR